MTRRVGGLEWKFHEAAVNATQGSVFFFLSAVPVSPSLPPCHPAARERRAIECGGECLTPASPPSPRPYEEEVDLGKKGRQTWDAEITSDTNI